MDRLIQHAGARAAALITMLVGVGFTLGVAREAEAQLNMTLSDTPGSSMITVSFSGSTTVTSQHNSAITDIGWEFTPTTYDPFPPQITGSDFGDFNFASGSATITIDGSPLTMTGVFLQDASNSPSRGRERFGTLGFTYRNLFVGEVFSWSGTATFDISGKGLTFSNLNTGSTGTLFASNIGGVAGSLSIVPEPSSVLAVLVCGLAVLSRLGSQRGGRQRGHP